MPIAFDQLLILLAGLMTILAINSAFLRHTLQPLRSLIHIMDRIDALEPGRRVEFPDAGSDVRRLAAAFNAMLERLEAEQRASTEMALSVQEGERQRIARELHDEVGQTLTAMLLQIESFFAARPTAFATSSTSYARRRAAAQRTFAASHSACGRRRSRSSGCRARCSRCRTSSLARPGCASRAPSSRICR